MAQESLHKDPAPYTCKLVKSHTWLCEQILWPRWAHQIVKACGWFSQVNMRSAKTIKHTQKNWKAITHFI